MKSNLPVAMNSLFSGIRNRAGRVAQQARSSARELKKAWHEPAPKPYSKLSKAERIERDIRWWEDN